MVMCSCGRWMVRKYISEPPFVCYYYDYCPETANGYDDYGNPTRYG